MSKIKFNCVDFDDDNKRINILNGDKGYVNYKDIAKTTILNEKLNTMEKNHILQR